MKIYIAGSITNNPNYKEEFKKAEEQILALGHTPLNPVKNLGFSYKDYIDMGLNELMRCDAILLLGGYHQSKGAILEYLYASTINLKMFYNIREIKENVDKT